MLWHVTSARVEGESPARWPSDTAWESYPGGVRPTRTVRPSPALCECCVGRPVSFHDTVAPTPVPPPRRPSKGDDDTLERGTVIYSAPARGDAVT
jgi:hypothetical protein